MALITKETTQRLLKDIKQIMKHSLADQGIYYKHDDTDILQGYAMIVGPSDTPYFGGYYFFQFKFPFDYPHSPPKITYCTNGRSIRFNPNLYLCGKVCISLLNTWKGEQWTSCQTISSVLLTLCTLLCKNPLLNEPGVNMNFRDVAPYNEIIEYANINVAVCDIVNKTPGIYLDFFDLFFPYIRETFFQHFDQWMEFVQSKCEIGPKEPYMISTGYYEQNVVIDYPELMKKLQETRNKL